jgi:hypothetical protein
MRDKLQTWLDTLVLDAKTAVLADLVLELAADYERTRNTSTAEAIRKNIMEINRAQDVPEPELDPLQELIKRHRG